MDQEDIQKDIEMLEEMSKDQIELKLEQVGRKIQVLQWDKSRRQLNPAKEAKLSLLIEKKQGLKNKLNELNE